MKRINRSVLIISVFLLIVDIIFVIKHLNTMNILHFLGEVIMLPCILISLIIASLIVEIPCKEVKHQGIIASILGAMVSIFSYIVVAQNKSYIDNIVENSKKMNGSSNLSISDISISNGITSYVFIFLMIFIFSMLFIVIFNSCMRKE